MQVATLTATLEAQIAAFQANMRAADEITQKMREALAGLEKQSATTSRELVTSGKEIAATSKATASQVSAAAEVQVSSAKKQIISEVAKRKELAKTAVEARAAAAAATQGSDEWVAATTVQLAAEKKLAAGVAAATAVMRERQAAALKVTSAPAFGGGFVVKGEGGKFVGSTANIEAMKLSEAEQARLTDLIKQTTAATTTGIESEVAARAEQARVIEGTIAKLTALRSEQEEGSKEWLAANQMIMASEKELQGVIGETAASAEKVVAAGVKRREQLAKDAVAYRELAAAAVAGSDAQIVAAEAAIKAEGELSAAVISATKLIEEKNNAIEVTGTVTQQAAALNVKANLAQQDTLLGMIAEYEALASASVKSSREQTTASRMAQKAQTELNALLGVTTKEVEDASAVQMSAAAKAVAAGVKQREELAKQVAEWHVIADVSAKSSNAQIVAANLAADAEKRLQAQLAAISGEQELSIEQIARARIEANAAEQASLRAMIAEWEAAAAAGNLSATEQEAATDLVTAAQRRLNAAIRSGAGENKAAAASAAVKNEELAAIRAGRGLATGIGGPGRALAFGSTAFITGIIGALSIRAVVGAATQEEQALKLLQNAMRNNGESWKEWGATVQRSVGKLAGASKFTKEDLFKGLLQLDLATKNVSTAQKDLGVAVNLSRQKQIELSTAVRDVVLVSEGHASILRRQGIVLPVVTSAQDKLKRMLAGVAAAGEKVTTSSKQQATALAKQSDLAATGALDMRILEQRVKGADAAFDKTTSGHMAAFHKALNDLAVAVGEGVIPVMNRVIERFDKWASNGRNIKAVADAIKQAFNDIVGAAKYFGDAFGLIDRATGSFKNTVIALIGLKLGFWVMSSVMNFKELFAVMKAGSFSSVLITVTLLALAIGALSKAFPGVKGAAKTMAVGLAALFVAIKLGWLDTMTAMVVSAVGASTTIGVAFAATGVGAVIIGFALLAEVVVTHWKQTKLFFVELWRDLKVGWEHLWLWLKLSALHTALDVVEPFSKLPGFLGGWARRAKQSLLASMDSVRASMANLGTSSGNKFGEAMYDSSVTWAKATRKLWGEALAPGKAPIGPRGPVGTPGVGPNGDMRGPIGAPVVHLKLPQKLMDMVAAAEAGHGNLAKADAAAYAFYEKQLQQPGLSSKQKRAIYEAEAQYAPASVFNPNLQTTVTSGKNLLPVAQRIALEKAFKEQAAMKPAVLADANTAQLRKWIQANEAAAAQARKTLGWLKEQHFTGEKLTKSLQLQKQLLNEITAAHRNIAAAMKAEAKAEKQAHVDAVNAKAMKILGIGPGGQPVLPGVTSLMGSERSMLISAANKLVKSETKGKGGLTADQISDLQKLPLPKLIEAVRKMGVELPKSTLNSLRKINEVFALALKEHVKLTSDVLTDLRDRLSQIKQSILASLSNGASIQNAYAGVTAASLIAGIPGLTPAQKLELEQRYAQSIAHGGRVPKGVAAQGIPVPAGGTATGPKKPGGGRGPDKPSFAYGGVAPGSGVGDTVPAWLTPGEIILNGPHQKMLRKMLGVEGGGPEHLFRALTGGMSRYMSRDNQKFASGGVVDKVRLRDALQHKDQLAKVGLTPAYVATHTDAQVSAFVDRHVFRGVKHGGGAGRVANALLGLFGMDLTHVKYAVRHPLGRIESKGPFKTHPGQMMTGVISFGGKPAIGGSAKFFVDGEHLPVKVMYHVAPTRDRLRIKAEGLRVDVPRRHPQEPLGNYLWATKEQAWKYATRGSGLGDVDIWAVKGGAHHLEKDPFFIRGPMWAKTAKQRREILENAKHAFGEHPGAYLKPLHISSRHLSLNEKFGGFANPWFTDKKIAEHMGMSLSRDRGLPRIPRGVRKRLAREARKYMEFFDIARTPIAMHIPPEKLKVFEEEFDRLGDVEKMHEEVVRARRAAAKARLSGKESPFIEEINRFLAQQKKFKHRVPPSHVKFDDLYRHVGHTVPDINAYVMAVNGAIKRGELERANTLLRARIFGPSGAGFGEYKVVLHQKLLDVAKMLKKRPEHFERPGVASLVGKRARDRIADEATKYLEFWEIARDVKPHTKAAASAEGVAHALGLKLEPLFPKTNAGAIRNRVPWPFTDMGGGSLPRETSIQSVKEFLAGRHSQKAIDMWVRMAMRNRNSAGGVITDGSGAGDDVPAMLSRGEIVLNRRQQDNIRRMAGLQRGSPSQLFNQVNSPSKPPKDQPEALTRYLANQKQPLDATARSLLPYLPAAQSNRPDPYGRYWASSVPGKPGKQAPPVGVANAASSRCCHCEEVHIGRVEINVNGSNKSPTEVAREVRTELIRNARRNATQTRGPNAGRSVGLS